MPIITIRDIEDAYKDKQATYGLSQLSADSRRKCVYCWTDARDIE